MDPHPLFFFHCFWGNHQVGEEVPGDRLSECDLLVGEEERREGIEEGEFGPF